jgi:hypothetical protein
MRLVQQRPAVALLVVDAVQAVRVVEAAVALLRAERKPDRAQPQMMVEGAAVVLLVVVPAAGTEAVRWPRVLKCRAWRLSTCCWLPALIRIRN